MDEPCRTLERTPGLSIEKKALKLEIHTNGWCCGYIHPTSSGKACWRCLKPKEKSKGHLAMGNLTERSQQQATVQGWISSTFLLAALCCKGVWTTFSGVLIANWLHVAMTPERNLKTFKLGRTRKALDVPMKKFGNMHKGKGTLPETNSREGQLEASAPDPESLPRSWWLLFAAKVFWTLLEVFSLQIDFNWPWPSK